MRHKPETNSCQPNVLSPVPCCPLTQSFLVSWGSSFTHSISFSLTYSFSLSHITTFSIRICTTLKQHRFELCRSIYTQNFFSSTCTVLHNLQLSLQMQNHGYRGTVYKRLECNPEIPVAPGEEHWLLDTPIFLPRQFHGQKSLVGYSP